MLKHEIVANFSIKGDRPLGSALQLLLRCFVRYQRLRVYVKKKTIYDNFVAFIGDGGDVKSRYTFDVTCERCKVDKLSYHENFMFLIIYLVDSS